MNEPDANYISGFPNKAGWFDCLVDGREDRLCCRFCPSCGRYEWRDINGVKVDGTVLYDPLSFEIYP